MNPNPYPNAQFNENSNQFQPNQGFPNGGNVGNVPVGTLYPTVIPMKYQEQQHYIYAQNDPFYNPYFNMQGQTYGEQNNVPPNFENVVKNPPFLEVKQHDLNLNHDKYMLFFQYDSVNVFAFDFNDRKYLKCPNYYNFTMLNFFRVAQTPEFTFVLTGGSHSDDSFSNNTYHYIDGYFYKQNEMRKARRAHCSVFHEGYVYVFGGSGSKGQLRDCERFKVAENKWEEIAPLNQERSLSSCCVFGKDQIFVIGGYNDKKQMDITDIEVFNVRNMQFTLAPCVTPLKIENPFVAQINESEIVIFGGFMYENSTESDNIHVVNVFNGKNAFKGKTSKPCWSVYCHPYLIRPDTFLVFHCGENEFLPEYSEVTIK